MAEKKAKIAQKIEVKYDPHGRIGQPPSYLVEMVETFHRWTRIKDQEVEEAIRDLSGNLFLELRKLQAVIFREIENRQFADDFKEFVKARINETWRDIINHQKIGINKLGIIIREHLPREEPKVISKEEPQKEKNGEKKKAN